MSTLASMLAAMPDAERRSALASLPAADLAALEFAYRVWARPEQLPPIITVTGMPWRTWVMLAGRGAGKSWAMASLTHEEIEAGRRRSGGLISPTSDTGRRDQVAALLAVAPPWFKPVHEPSQRRLVYPNGAICHVLSSEEPDRIRGLNLDWAWVDELCACSNYDDTWSNLQLALRVPGPLGDAPVVVVSTTPKRNQLLKAILADPSTVVTRASTFANAANLDAATLGFLQNKYGGSTLGRQELLGELLDDLDGALWNRAMLNECRITTLPERLRRIVVAVDPAGGSSRKSDETGIVAAGLGHDARGYVIADASGRYSPDGWARAAVGLYQSLKADRIVAEANFGGEMVAATIRSVDPSVPVRLVTASRGKAVRAEPIVAFYEQRRVHHVGNLPGLEDQLCSWDPASSGNSPDRLDALVWALTDLMTTRPPMRISAEALRGI